MKKFLVLFILAFLFMGCAKNAIVTTNACNSANPIEEVDWLKAMKNSLTNCSCEMSIIQGTYNNQTVFFTMITDPLCNSVNMPTLYSCEGKVVRVFNETDYREFNDKVTTVKVLYRCKTTK
ncbi:hypothetical protein [uncultured Acetobacteroides sp.]|uniref:hypothetical protein n=1 Tax=uncultured Acetobacteroides sp. TaxID=1760811 RepID=UPI0029F546D5|nr:hypothetical protein [uncultured Acetobacteroides sp.]